MQYAINPTAMRYSSNYTIRAGRIMQKQYLQNLLRPYSTLENNA